MKIATPQETLLAALAAKRPAEQQRALARIHWGERLTSLWAPVFVFLAAFAPYVLLVQLHYPSHLWAQPALKAIGLAMVAWFAVLAPYRLARPASRKRRRARVEASELLAQLDKELRRSRDLNPQARERIVQQAVALDAARTSEDADAPNALAGKLGQLADKSLPGWRRRTTVDGVKGLLWTLLAVLLLRTLFVEPFRIPTGSMLPTLNLGDHVVVNRFIYGVRIPFINVVPFQILRAPRRGDVIVFNNPVNTSEDFIKRVVGLPGDRVEIKDETVYVNGVAAPRSLVAQQTTVWNRNGGEGPWFEERPQLFEESLDGRRHAVLRQADDHHRAYEGPYLVPEGHVFVLGDNRDQSADSRYGFRGEGNPVEYVPYGNIKGKAMVIWLSLSYGGLGSGLFGGTGLRTDRLFTPLE